jgi:hypothetical protein
VSINFQSMPSTNDGRTIINLTGNDALAPFTWARECPDCGTLPALHINGRCPVTHRTYTQAQSNERRNSNV